MDDMKLSLQELRLTQLEQNKVLARIERALWGDDSDDNPGHIKRLDRLEQRDKTRARLTWAAVTATMGLFFKTVVWPLLGKQ